VQHVRAWLVATGLLVALVGSTILLDDTDGPDGSRTDVARLERAPILREGRDTVNAVTRKDWLFGALMVCLDRPGRVEIREVVPDGDLSVTGFATRPNPMARGELGVGSVPATLEAHGLSPQPLTLVCDGSSLNLHEVVVELRAGEHTTSTKGFTIHYVSGGHRLQRYYEKEIVLCVDAREGVCPRIDNAA
jgi:hypothetical protein